MKSILSIVSFLLGATFRSRLSLHMEILALRHQLTVYQRSGKRLHIQPADRILIHSSNG
jgi:hypothetical protein